jgi:hypothetical protein
MRAGGARPPLSRSRFPGFLSVREATKHSFGRSRTPSTREEPRRGDRGEPNQESDHQAGDHRTSKPRAERESERRKHQQPGHRLAEIPRQRSLPERGDRADDGSSRGRTRRLGQRKSGEAKQRNVARPCKHAAVCARAGSAPSISTSPNALVCIRHVITTASSSIVHRQR